LEDEYLRAVTQADAYDLRGMMERYGEDVGKQTALMGDKAKSSAYEGDQKLNFLQNGKVFASYTISELLKGP